MKYILALAFAAAALFVAGCTDDQANDYRSDGPIGGDYHPVEIPYAGGSLTCIRLDTGGAHYSDSGLSCDWVRWHEEHPNG